MTEGEENSDPTMAKDVAEILDDEANSNGKRRRRSSKRSQSITTRDYHRMHQLFWQSDVRISSNNKRRTRSAVSSNSIVGNMVKRHDSPHIYVYDDFLKPREVEFLLNLQKPFQKSFVDDGKTTSVDKDYRTSTFVSLQKQENSMIAGIERRAADLLGLSASQIEPLQLVRYKEGQFFGIHHDLGTLNDTSGEVELPPRMYGSPRRIATIFCYLNSVQKGGCTYFPNCGNLRVEPKQGRAVVWSNILESGMPDADTIHAGEAVLGKSVIKYGLNIWACES